MPRSIEITSDEVTEAISDITRKIIAAAKGVLEQIPPELASDIINKGIMMSGGTSVLRNFDKMVTNETGVPAHVAEDPMLCVVRGTGLLLEDMQLLKEIAIPSTQEEK